MQDNNVKLCLNLYTVRKRMEERELTKKKLSAEIGMKDYHTLSYYFKHPDRIRLEHVTAIAKALGDTSFLDDNYILRTRNDEEFRKLVEDEEA